MINILLLSDVHIANRRQHNLEGDALFRLKQFLRLADRIYHYVVDNKMDEIWLAGDLVDVAVLQPEEAHVVHRFIQRLLETGVKLRFTLGNHDIDSKSDTDDGADRSIVPLLMDYDNIVYMHKKILEVEGLKVAFQNWEHDLSTIDWFDHADLYIGHVNILEGNLGQAFDQSRFDLGLCGDIHMKTKKGKTHSVGCPIQSNAGDDPNGCFVHLSLDKGSIDWKYVQTIVPGEYDFLRVFRSDKMPDDYQAMKYDVIREITVPEQLKDVDDDQIEKLFDSNSAMTEALSEETDEIAQLISDKMRTIHTESLDLNTLKFGTLKIKNFRSIDYREIDLSALEKLNRITGHIGQGKSTIVRALDYVLNNSGSAKSKIKIGEKDMLVEVDFWYRGHHHVVKRSSQYIDFWSIDGEEQEAGKKIDLDKRFQSDNVWLQAWSVMYQNQMSIGFLMQIKQADRVTLLSRLLGFEKILETHKSLKTEAKSITADIKKKRTELVQMTAVNDAKQGELNGTLEELEDQLSDIQDSIEKVEIALTKSRAGIVKCRDAIALFDKQESAKAELDKATTELNSMEKPGELPDVVSDMEFVAEYNKLPNQLTLNSIVSKGKAAREVLNNPPDTCKECGGPLKVSPEWTAKQEKIIDDLTQEYVDTEVLVKKRQDQHQQLLDAEKRIGMRDEMQRAERAYNAVVDRVKMCQERYDNIDVGVCDRSDFESDLADYNQEVEEFNDKMVNLKVEQNKLKEYHQDHLNLAKARENQETAEEALEAAEVNLNNINSAVEATSMDGPVLSKTMAAAASVLSDGVVNVQTTKVSAGKTVPDFNVSLNVPNIGEVSYDDLSGGQLNLVDVSLIMRLAKLIGGLPLVILDESLCFSNQEIIVEVLSGLQKSEIDKVILISHNADTPQITNYIEA